MGDGVKGLREVKGHDGCPGWRFMLVRMALPSVYSIHVDNFIDSIPSPEEAEKLMNEAEYILSKEGFGVKKMIIGDLKLIG